MELYWTMILATAVISIIYLLMKVQKIRNQQKRIEMSRERICTKADEIRRILRREKV